MSKISKAIAALGIVAGLGVSTIPLSTYAAGSGTSSVTTIKSTVEETLAIAVMNTAGSTALQSGVLDLGKLVVNGPIVSQKLDVVTYLNSGIPFNVTISPAEDGKTDMVGAGNAGRKIPAKSSFGNGVAGWGFREIIGTEPDPWQALDSTGTELGGGYVGEPLASTETINGLKYDYSYRTTIEFGAAASTSTVPDTYNVKVVFTSATAF